MVAPRRDWVHPGCRRGARYLLDADSCAPTRDHYPLFDSRRECLEWMMAHRQDIARSAPEATVRPVDLARWLLGLE